MKLLLVVNPISGGVDKTPFLNRAEPLLKKYGIAYRIFNTTGKNDREHLQMAIEEFRPDRVVSVGGDGTTLFTATTLMSSNIPMGIIPLGSANGMAVELNVNPNPIEALKDIIMSQIIAGLDMVCGNDKHYSIHIGDVGINARIVDAYSKDPNRGMITYAKYFIEELQRLEPFPVKIKTDDKELETLGVMAAICNSRKYGTGVPINIAGNPLDGKFEIVIVENINLNSLILAGLASFNEKFATSQNGFTISTTKAQLSFDKPRVLQLDGEVIGEFSEVKAEIIESAVNFITHSENPHLNTA